jgi:hypothetical protein
MPSAGFELAIPAVGRLQIYALDRTTIEISFHIIESAFWKTSLSELK